MKYSGLKRIALMLILGLVASVNFGDPSTESLVKQLVQKVKREADQIAAYGFIQTVVTSKLNGEGGVDQRDHRTYRTLWLEDQSYNELFQINGKPLCLKERQEELKRFGEFVTSVRGGKKSCGIQQELKSIPWWEVPEKYDFTQRPAEGTAKIVLSFRPKQGRLPERCRFERVLNHLEGTVWLNEDLDVLRVDARLTEPVRFGLGIVAKVEDARINYRQQSYDGVWLPDSLSVAWTARIAMFSHQRRTMQVNWDEPYARVNETSPLVVMNRIKQPGSQGGM